MQKWNLYWSPLGRVYIAPTGASNIPSTWVLWCGGLDEATAKCLYENCPAIGPNKTFVAWE